MRRPQTKAAGFNSSITTVRGMVTKEEFERFVAGLPPVSAALIQAPPLAMSWIPMEQTIEVHGRIFSDLFRGDPERMFEFGRRQFLADMNTMYKAFIRVASPRFVAGRAASIYETYTRDAGTMKVARDEERLIDLLVEGHPFPTTGNWAYLRGTVHAVIELTGVKDVKVKIAEGGGGSARCLYRITWS